MVDRLISYHLGLLGHPVGHSQSPRIHAAFARQFGLHVDYQLLDVTSNQLPLKLKEFMSTAHGCNITVPHKTDVMPLLDHYTEKARLCQAVNTVFWRDEELWGDNTDGDGLVLDLRNKGIHLKDLNALVIGAGGASQGIIPSLLKQGIGSIEIQNRDNEKARLLASRFDHCYLAGSKMQKPYDLIIHATSMGHQGLAPELKEHMFHDGTIAYDLSYGKAAEPFLNSAKAIGAKQVFDGLGMLYGQAALAFEIWFGEKPDIDLL